MRTAKGLFISTFFLVFIAELGDKTQIAAFSLAAKHGSMLPVLMGAALALITSTLLAVSAGHFLASKLPKNLLKTISGLLFLLTGIFLLLRAFEVL